MNYLYQIIALPLIFILSSCAGIKDDFVKDITNNYPKETMPIQASIPTTIIVSPNVTTATRWETVTLSISVNDQYGNKIIDPIAYSYSDKSISLNTTTASVIVSDFKYLADNKEIDIKILTQSGLLGAAKIIIKPIKYFYFYVESEGKNDYGAFMAYIFIKNYGDLNILESSTITAILMKNNIEIKRYIQPLNWKIKPSKLELFKIYFYGINNENDYDEVIYEQNILWEN